MKLKETDGNILPFIRPATAFNPVNAVISIGMVRVNKISQHLAGLADEVKAQFLVSPKSTAVLFRCAPGTWHEDVDRIGKINARHGLHFKGRQLVGLKISDGPRGSSLLTYERAAAKEIKAAWERAQMLHQPVTTRLMMPSMELVCDRAIGSTQITVENNLYSRVDDINAAAARQGGEMILANSPGFYQHSSNNDPIDSASACRIDMQNGSYFWERKDDFEADSWPVALHFPAPGL